MYKNLIRPLLFLLEPENAHRFAARAIKVINCLPGFHWVAKKMFNTATPNSGIEICGLPFKNRVGLAAGFDKNADLYKDFALFGFSFIEIGTVTPLPQPGNPKPRLFRIKKDKAMVNRMGFNNKGVEYAVKRLKKRKQGLVVGGNIGKNTLTPNDVAAKDYAICFERLYDHVDYFTINISCPNIKGMEGIQDRDSIKEILNRIMNIRKDRRERKPVFLKISPDFDRKQIDEILDLYFESGLDGLVVANTTTRRDALTASDETIKKIGIGGLSGRPLKERIKNLIVYICKHKSLRIPVIAVGGIMSPDDAAEMIRAGAVLVQIYTGFIYEGPFLVKRINKYLDNMLSGN